MTDYEQLGAFYLGTELDPATKAPGAPVMYDARDLTTHAVCVGVTGSGKTGLCLTLIEEALIDGVPVLAIDPKGDLGNLMLTFPALRPADFAPWGDPAQAASRARSAPCSGSSASPPIRCAAASTCSSRSSSIARGATARTWSSPRSPRG